MLKTQSQLRDIASRLTRSRSCANDIADLLLFLQDMGVVIPARIGLDFKAVYGGVEFGCHICTDFRYITVSQERHTNTILVQATSSGVYHQLWLR